MTIHILSTTTAISSSSNANFQAWVTEFINSISAGGATGLQLVQLPDSGQINPATVAVPVAINTNAGYAMFRFIDTLGTGPLSTSIAMVNAANGTGYDAGGTHTYTAVPLTGGSGSGAQATIVVTAGVCGVPTITTAGTGYNIGDLLSASNTNLGGSGSGLSMYVTALNASASPVVIKFCFGLGAGLTQPYIWVQVGCGSNGAGTITGGGVGSTAFTPTNALTNNGPVGCAIANASIPGASVYISRFVYNPTLGFFGCSWKQGVVTAGLSLGGFAIFRSNNSSGVATGDAVAVLTNSATAIGVNTSNGSMQNVSYLTGLMYPVTSGGTNLGWWAYFPFNITTSLYSGNAQIAPVFTMTPVLQITANLGIALQAEIGLGSTLSVALVGSTPITMLQVGAAYGGSTIGPGSQGLSSAYAGLLFPWQ